MKKSEGPLTRLDAFLGPESRAQRIWLWAAVCVLLLYAAAAVLGEELLRAASPALSAARILLVLLLCAGGLLLCRKIRFSPVSRTLSRGRTALFFLAASALTFGWGLLWQHAYWPGSFSPDSFEQFAQVTSGQYNNWHPVLQTWLFFTLPYRLFGSSAAMITAQLAWFSLAVGYLFTVLYKNGCPWWFMFLGWVYILADPNGMIILLHPWKDPAMSIFALVLFAQVIQIYASGGQWLRRWYNIAAFALFAFLTNAMRHNAVLLVAPVFVILFLFQKTARKGVLLAAAGAVAATLLLQGPVFSLAKVEQPDQRVVETMGLPMTVLCEVYTTDPDSLSPEIRTFMASLATPEEWASLYSSGSFNSIKWYSSQSITEKVDAAGRGTLLRYMFQAFRASPRHALTGLGRLTDMVWCVHGSAGWTVPIRGYNPPGSFAAWLDGVFSAWGALTARIPLRYLFNFIGTVILVMLVAAVSCIGGGLDRAFMVLAPLAYDFGTMLLLSGDDFRFFHFNFVIVVPLLYLFLSRKEPSQHEI